MYKIKDNVWKVMAPKEWNVSSTTNFEVNEAEWKSNSFTR